MFVLSISILLIYKHQGCEIVEIVLLLSNFGDLCLVFETEATPIAVRAYGRMYLNDGPSRKKSLK